MNAYTVLLSVFLTVPFVAGVAIDFLSLVLASMHACTLTYTHLNTRKHLYAHALCTYVEFLHQRTRKILKKVGHGKSQRGGESECECTR
jgi:hypothetical protein